MINTLLKLAENLIKLRKYQNELPTKQFEKSIEPLFHDLTKVHQNYLKLFEKCAEGLKNEEDIAKIASTLFADRLELEAVRRSISAIAESLAHNKKLDKFQLFFLEVRNYFFTNTFAVDTRSTILLNEIEQFLHKKQDGKLVSKEFSTSEIRQFLLQLVEKMLNEIRQAWDKITKLHATALSDVMN